MKQLFTMMAGYNRWANRRLYAAAARLPRDDYFADQKAFFGSLHGTLNHILVGDRVWMRRFTGEGPYPSRLDEILYDTLEDLTAAREAEDERIVAFADALTNERIAGTFTYTPLTDPTEITQPLAGALVHVFNHQTHHRGQAHCLLTQLGHDAPPLDLIYFQRETGIGIETSILG